MSDVKLVLNSSNALVRVSDRLLEFRRNREFAKAFYGAIHDQERPDVLNAANSPTSFRSCSR